MRRRFLQTLAFVAAILTACLRPAVAQRIALPQLPSGPPQAVIYYDGPQAIHSEGVLDSRQILNLLGHFSLKGEIKPLGSYRAGDLSRYRAAFFVGTAAGTRFPEGFLQEVRNFERPFAWIGRHLEYLIDTPESRARFGFVYEDYRDDLEFRQVVYKGVTLPKEDPDLNLVKIENANAVQVLAEARSAEAGSYPYALRRGRFWYFADIPFSYAEEGGRYLVFSDLLHDVLQVEHASSSMALVRLEDVSTDSDADALRDIADRMARLRVPFQIALIPVYRQPAQGIEVRLTDRPTFADTLKYTVARGATPVLHGVTHQYQGLTGDDFEFWNVVENRPVAGDSADYVLDRLRIGLPEVFAAGIHPIAFETPHYAASEIDYAALLPHFSFFYERTMTTPDLGSVQFFPYTTVDGFGRTIVPENLGYLPEDNPDPQVLIRRARALRVVRDGIASFYFHPFLNPALLEETVQGISRLGYQFVSLRQFGGGLNFQGRYAVVTQTGGVRLAPNNEFWRVRVYRSDGTLLDERVSENREQGSIEIDVEVPEGGWAAAECLRTAPAPAPLLTWRERLGSWFRQVSAGWTEPLSDFPPVSPPVWLLWLEKPSKEDANNQQSYRTVFETFGYRVEPQPVGNFSQLPPERNAIIVVSESVGLRLSASQQSLLLEHVTNGGGLIADGQQPWLSSLGFRFTGRRIPVTKVVDVLFPEMALRWQPEELVERFDAPEGSRQLMMDPESRQMLATAGHYGAGSYLYLSVPLDEHTPEASSHYPYFAEYLEETFPRRSSLRSPRLEVYFDPGYRQGANLERLATQWRQNGVRIIYAAAWQVYPNYRYDYDRLIRVAHQNGIAVYAWFVLPQVTPKMWQERPDCRERTATGADGNVGWRLLINLENKACFNEAIEWMHSLLTAHDWDGVNLAELNYDADWHDYRRADRFVPMNADVRGGFETLAGFDPALLFSPSSGYARDKNPAAWEKFLQYREDRVTELHRRVLQFLQPIQRDKGWEVIVTMLDSLHSGYVRPALGVNSRRIAALMNEFDFTLQVEDPAEHWNTSADRYRRFAQTYLRLVPDSTRLMFDINVMPDRAVDGTSLPSALATGTELARTVRAAASASGRVAIYSESTVPSQDWGLLGQALAADALLAGSGANWNAQAAVPVRLLPAQNRTYYLDGTFWPAAATDGVMLPAGEHDISLYRPWYQFFERGEMQTMLLNLSGNLLAAKASPTGISLQYDSPGRAVILLNQPAREMRLNGQSVSLPVQGAAGRWWVLAPKGRNSLEIITTTESGVVLNIWSWFSASAITLYGALTSLMMMAIYLYIRLRRLVRRKGAAG
jgi:hypothetical protein